MSAPSMQGSLKGSISMSKPTLVRELLAEVASMGHAANCTWTATTLAGEGSTVCDCRASRLRALAYKVKALEKSAHLITNETAVLLAEKLTTAEATITKYEKALLHIGDTAPHPWGPCARAAFRAGQDAKIGTPPGFSTSGVKPGDLLHDNAGNVQGVAEGWPAIPEGGGEGSPPIPMNQGAATMNFTKLRIAANQAGELTLRRATLAFIDRAEETEGVLRAAVDWDEEWVKTDSQCPVCGGSHDPFPQHEDHCWIPAAHRALDRADEFSVSRDVPGRNPYSHDAGSEGSPPATAVVMDDDELFARCAGALRAYLGYVVNDVGEEYAGAVRGLVEDVERRAEAPPATEVEE